MRESPALSARSRAWLAATTALCLLPLLLQLPAMLAVVFAVSALLTIGLAWRQLTPPPLRLILLLAMLAAVYWQSGMRLGRDTGCALLAAMLAIKSSELRNLRDGRSLLGFALFAPFSAFLLDQGPLTTALSLLAVLAAVLCMAQLADAESHVDAPSWRAQWRVMRRLTVLGLPLALAAFWLFPRLGSPLWGIPERTMSRPGLSDHMSPGEWIDLMADDTPALRAQFFGAVPPPEQRYWRGPVLWDFDGRDWTSPQWHAASAMPAVQPGAARWDYQIDYEATDDGRLVALDLPLQAPSGARLSPDYELMSQRPLTGMTRWRLQSAPPQAFEASLPASLRRAALRLPQGYNPRTLTLGRQWRSEAGSDDAAIVRRAMQWIHAEFAYTLETPLPGRDGVDDFLFGYKAGFCEHFSSAFVVLMRAAGVPARVVTGYVGGVRNPIGGYYVVRRMDAHAWAEVWMAGRGWVRVDPTAAVAPERVYDTLENRLAQQDGGQPQANLRWAGNVGDWLRRGWNDLVLSFNAERQQRLLRPLGFGELNASQLIALFVCAALLALGWMAWLLARGERERDPLLRAWHRLGRRYARHGLAREPHEPAGAWATRVDGELGDPKLVILSQRFAEARYAAAVADSARRQLLKDLQQHRPNTGASP
ncbi:MAG TPA: DUF3488 and transglutaminase-like domain-containing protein [Stenotrophomonas sp.]|nr:DUF3488 and transglutaminase-like domain-containing protein [Stenotrophomonas sp.]